MSQITIFQNINDTSTPFYRDIDVILARIKEGKSKEVVNAIRKEKDREERNKLKKKLPAICFSGTFKKRNDTSLIDHSGYICLDFDGYPSKKEMMAARDEIISDRYVYSCFVSPSGDGLKVIVRIPKDSMNHKHYFKSLQQHFNSQFFDPTSKNISRVCYESYDPLIYINEFSDIWDSMTQESKDYSTDETLLPKIRLTKTDEIIRRLLSWWDKNYGIVEGERNNNVYILAGRFNKFGISQMRAAEECLRFAHDGFASSEIMQIVNSAYKKTEDHNTRFFEDVEKYEDVRTKFKEGASKRDLKASLREDGVEDDVIDAVLSEVERDLAVPVFWSVNERGTVSLLHYEFKEFLEDNGYYKYAPDGTRSYIFVKVTNNLIDDTSEEEIKDFILNYALENAEINIYNFFAEKTKYFREEFLNILSPVDVYFVSDTKDSAYLYYRNCAVRVTKNSIDTVDYIDLGGYVWKRQVIQRDFKLHDVDSCDFKIFVNNVCGGDAGRVASLESTIGYLLHGFKNLGYCPAVILNDEVITENPEGGTGKGIFVNAIGKMKNLVVLDGKSFSFEKSFTYQLVSSDTQILTFDDVRKAFDFERLFSIVTEGITIEKKNKDAIKIPFESSPKVIITTNYAIRGKGNSFERRKWELEFASHYSKDFTPENEFGKLLFADWDENEWLLFDNYMISNLQSYLGTGFVKSGSVNLKTRKFMAETDYSFYEWVSDPLNDAIRYNQRLYGNDLWNAFIADYPDFSKGGKRHMSQTRFYDWLNTFANYQCGRDMVGGRDMRGKWLIIEKDEEL
jgi:hypothetical protein